MNKLHKPLFLGMLAFLLTLGPKLSAQNFSNGFSFNLPWDDTTTQSFLPQFPRSPINDSSFVAIDANGHFAVDGERIRFWGSNLVASACFPDTADAGLIAGRMRKTGFNLMRFHHMDHPGWSNQIGFFAFNQPTRNPNPVAFDRFEYLISKMKQEGVYANINLNVSRTFHPQDGIAGADSLPTFGKGVTLFDPQLIALQKEFATQLLTHVNPYTGLSLVDDPVMAMLEVVNENSLYRMWKFDELRPFTAGGELMKRHSDMLDSLWIAFLRKKYGTQASLATAWDVGVIPPSTGNQIINSGFEVAPLSQNWIMELHSTADATFTQDTTNPYSGAHAVRVDVNQVTGTGWHMQFKQTGLTAQEDSVYTVRFLARADRNRSLSVTLMRDNSPYTWYGESTVQVNTQWQEYTASFRASEDNTGQMRLAFGFNNETGSLWLDEVTLGKAFKRGMPDGQDLDSGKVKRILYADRFTVTTPRIADQTEFYIELQTRFNLEMKSFLRDTLGVKVPITANNALNGPGELMSQSVMDYIDDHAYWDHPQFPNVPWSSTDWLINNTAMFEADPEQATVAGLYAGLPMVGKPYTVSEYRHPFPNRYEAEMMLWMLAYGAMHDADGIMFYEYNGDIDTWKQDRQHNYFSTHRNPALTAMNMSFAYAFRKGLLYTPPHVVEIDYDSTSIFHMPLRDPSANGWGKEVPFDRRSALEYRIRTKGFQASSPPNFSAIPPFSGNAVISSGSMLWNTTENYLDIHADGFRATVGRGGDFGETHFQLTEANGFAAVSELVLKESSNDPYKASLLTISPHVQNTSMSWSDTTSINNNWGRAPIANFPFTGKFKLRSYADSLKVTPLDEKGALKSQQFFWVHGGPDFEIPIDLKRDETLWYVVEAFGDGLVGLEESLAEAYSFKLYPNPARDVIHLQFDLSAAEDLQLVLTDLTGRQLFQRSLSNRIGPQRERLDVSQLPAGVYQVHLRGARGRVVKRFARH